MPHKHRRRHRGPKLVHRALQFGRLVHESSDREKAFADEWERECQRRPGINYGQGLLQDLMAVPDNHAPSWVRERPGLFFMGGMRFAFKITPREATIAATVVQWFGTNCGWGFLETVVRKCGYLLVRREDWQRDREELRAARAELARIRESARRIRAVAAEVAG